jgi:predicted secreted protein
MKKILVAVIIMTASLLCLAACAAAPNAAIVKVTCGEFNEQATINQEVVVALDGLLMVSLCSDPATGYEWYWHIIGPNIVDEVDLEDEPVEGDPDASGMEVRTFKAWKKGKTTLVMEQARPTAPEEKGPWKLNLSVTVR